MTSFPRCYRQGKETNPPLFLQEGGGKKGESGGGGPSQQTTRRRRKHQVSPAIYLTALLYTLSLCLPFQAEVLLFIVRRHRKRCKDGILSRAFNIKNICSMLPPKHFRSTWYLNPHHPKCKVRSDQHDPTDPEVFTYVWFPSRPRPHLRPLPRTSAAAAVTDKCMQAR